MDAVELARQAAARLHLELVLKGKDPWDSYNLAVAAADARGLVVESSRPGAAILRGARAIFLPREALIVHENSGSSFDKAFLVAHEVGHAVLGDGADDGAADIDPVRSAERSPVGADRVVDYGRRQRREVQMDLYARELLLPRPWLRELHIHAGMTASLIAEKIAGPFDVVGQQLLDALLLGESVESDTRGGATRLPNEAQRVAARHRGSPYLLEAGPGTGKTQTLMARVEGLLAEGIDPRKILLLTFSNKAAGEMVDRLATSRPDAAAAMWIGTFHAFGLDVVRRFRAELGFGSDPRLLDRTEAIELLEQEFPRLGLLHYRDFEDPTDIIADVLSAISRAKDEVVDPAEYAELAARMRAAARDDEAKEAAERAMEVARVYAAYETLKRASNCVDFGDLVAHPARLLESNEAVRNVLRCQYDHVLVDEYQDVNRSSVRLLIALCGSGDNLWVVGDAKQSIYRFRGASSHNVVRFGGGDFPTGVRGRLTINYRSREEIVEAFSSFAGTMSVGGSGSQLVADRGASGNVPEIRTVENADSQPAAIAAAVAEMRRAGYAYRDQAVLCTGQEGLAGIAAELEALGVPILFLGSLFERQEVRDLLALLSMLTDKRGAALVRIATWPEFRMPMADVQRLLGRLRDSTAPAASRLREGQLRDGISAEAASSLDALATALAGFDSASSPWQVMTRVLLDRTRIAARLSEASGDAAGRTRGIAVWQLMNFVRAQPTATGLPVVRLLDRVRRLVRLGDDRDLRQIPASAQSVDAVRLMTVHGAKGLEFAVVHFPGLTAAAMPRAFSTPACPVPDGMVKGGAGNGLEASRRAHEEEQECLFFVALSRARDRLIMYVPARQNNGSRRPPSPFLQRIGGGIRRSPVALPAAGGADDDLVQMALDGPLQLEARALALYDKCPRRFLYTYVLMLGGRRTATPYVQMHDAVISIVRKLHSGAIERVAAAPRELVDAAFKESGLSENGYAEHYREVAVRMLDYYLALPPGTRPTATERLVLQIGADEIVVTVDEICRKDGKPVFRTVRSGRARSSGAKDLAAAAALASVQAAGGTFEQVSLMDHSASRLDLSTREVHNREQKLTAVLGAIRAGNFPIARSARMCSGCPAFFVCGPVPEGAVVFHPVAS